MTAAAPSPLLFPLAGLLKTRGAIVTLNAEWSKLFAGERELRVTVPLLAQHRHHRERRIVVGINRALESFDERFKRRGVRLLSVSAEGLCTNVEGLADTICEHIFRVSIEDLREMIQAGMSLNAIHAFTGIDQREIARMVPRFYGMTIQELRESQ